MLKHRNLIPLDYGLCRMTVTVYDKTGGRRVLPDVHYEFTNESASAAGKTAADSSFLLVIPGSDPIAVGDKILPGVGADIPFDALNPARFPTLGIVRSVKPRYFMGKPCHTEARG